MATVAITATDLDGMCGRLESLSDALLSDGLLDQRSAKEDARNVEEIIQLLQCIGETVAGAYATHWCTNPALGETFAQPFVDWKVRGWLKHLLVGRAGMDRNVKTALSKQVLQTVHILLQAAPLGSILRCSLTSGYYLNAVIGSRLDLHQTDDDLLPLWMTVVKDVAKVMARDEDAISLFFDPTSTNPFPILAEICRYYHHPVSQIRTHVQAASLDVFLGVCHENVWVLNSPLPATVLHESAKLFTHVCCLLREVWRVADKAVVDVLAGESASEDTPYTFLSVQAPLRDLRAALHIQNDIAVYLNDVLACQVPGQGEILEEKLLRFAIIPFLVRSVVAQRPATASSCGPLNGTLLQPHLAWHLLLDLLATLQSAAVKERIANVFLRPFIPEDVARLFMVGPAPRTPSAYLSDQRSWGAVAQLSPFDLDDGTSDDALYGMPACPLADLIANADSLGGLMRNPAVEALEEWLNCAHQLDRDGKTLKFPFSSSLPSTCVLLVRALRINGLQLDAGVAERISAALAVALSSHSRLPWPTLSAIFLAISEIAVASSNFSDNDCCTQSLVSTLRSKVLGPLAAELRFLLKRCGDIGQEQWWIAEFEKHWLSSDSVMWTLPCTAQLRRQCQEQTPQDSEFHLAEARSKCLKVLVGTWRLLSRFSSQDQKYDSDFFGKHLEPDVAHIKPGVAFHLEKNMRIIKCSARVFSNENSDQTDLLADLLADVSGNRSAFYLLVLPSKLVLIQPVEEKPFWAVPMVCEPLSNLRIVGEASILGLGKSSFAHSPPVLDVEFTIAEPRSPVFAANKSVVARLALTFADDRRRRVALRSVVQALQVAHTKALDDLVSFLAHAVSLV